MNNSIDILGQDGLFQQKLSDFTPRSMQQEMANTVEDAIRVKANLVIEAGTGTGKTFAYLVPAFLANKTVIVATGTKNLQDQIIAKDIPLIKRVLNSKTKVAVLKGRANYLCLYRLYRNWESGRLKSKRAMRDLHKIYEWSILTKSGDFAELNTVKEKSSIWGYVSSSSDNCLGKECKHYQDCFIAKARMKAIKSDIIIVNHHLFFADMALREEGFGEVLPNAKVIIFDEAHQLPEIASNFFSTRFSSRQILELANDIIAEQKQTAKDDKELAELAHILITKIDNMRLVFGTELKRSLWATVKANQDIRRHISLVKEALNQTHKHLNAIAVRSKELDNIFRRCNLLLELFNAVTTDEVTDNVHWYELFPKSFCIYLTPLDIADNFREYMKEHKGNFIFTSATLTVDHSFNHFVTSLGLENAIEMQLGSPFDYKNKTLLYVPRGLPDPNSQDYTSHMITALLPVLTASKGRAFILFTSNKALQKAELLLQEKTDFSLFVQGHKPKQRLVEEFCKVNNGVLLGTSSFWQGVDIKGDKLSCVIIDKLPFASPADPLVKARARYAARQGRDSFASYSLPSAVLLLKQGFGRLIRSENDWGLFVIADPRIVAKNYGKVFLKSLPDLPRTRELGKVAEFFNKTNGNENTSN